LELFKVVAEKKSFSHASELLHISQPAISQQIHLLEEELGIKKNEIFFLIVISPPIY